MDNGDKLYDKIKSGAIDKIKKEHSTNTNLFIEKTIYKPGQKIIAGHESISVNRDTVMVFADDEPLHNWRHKCRYLLYDSDTGDLVGTGPFVYDNYIYKDEVNLHAFTNYWGGEANFSTLKFDIIEEDLNRTNALLNGDIDINLDILKDNISVFEADPNFEFSRPVYIEKGWKHYSVI